MGANQVSEGIIRKQETIRKEEKAVTIQANILFIVREGKLRQWSFKIVSEGKKASAIISRRHFQKFLCFPSSGTPYSCCSDRNAFRRKFDLQERERERERETERRPKKLGGNLVLEKNSHSGNDDDKEQAQT